MTQFKRLASALNQMTEHTYTVLRNALILTCIMMFCALILALNGGFDANKIAQELMGLGAVTLLLGTIISAIVEERGRK